MSEEERNSSRLSEIDRLYGYQEPIQEEDEDEDKSIAEQMTDALKKKREAAFHNLKKKW